MSHGQGPEVDGTPSKGTGRWQKQQDAPDDDDNEPVASDSVDRGTEAFVGTNDEETEAFADRGDEETEAFEDRGDAETDERAFVGSTIDAARGSFAGRSTDASAAVGDSRSPHLLAIPVGTHRRRSGPRIVTRRTTLRANRPEDLDDLLAQAERRIREAEERERRCLPFTPQAGQRGGSQRSVGLSRDDVHDWWERARTASMRSILDAGLAVVADLRVVGSDGSVIATGGAQEAPDEAALLELGRMLAARRREPRSVRPHSPEARLDAILKRVLDRARRIRDRDPTSAYLAEALVQVVARRYALALDRCRFEAAATTEVRNADVDTLEGFIAAVEWTTRSLREEAAALQVEHAAQEGTVAEAFDELGRENRAARCAAEAAVVGLRRGYGEFLASLEAAGDCPFPRSALAAALHAAGDDDPCASRAARVIREAAASAQAAIEGTLRACSSPDASGDDDRKEDTASMLAALADESAAQQARVDDLRARLDRAGRREGDRWSDALRDELARAAERLDSIRALMQQAAPLAVSRSGRRAALALAAEVNRSWLARAEEAVAWCVAAQRPLDDAVALRAEMVAALDDETRSALSRLCGSARRDLYRAGLALLSDRQEALSDAAARIEEQTDRFRQQEAGIGRAYEELRRKLYPRAHSFAEDIEKARALASRCCEVATVGLLMDCRERDASVVGEIVEALRTFLRTSSDDPASVGSPFDAR